MQILVHSHQVGRWAVLTVAGELDVVGGPDLRQHVMSVTQTGQCHLILDLSGVDFVDSFGLGVLVGALKRTRLAGGDVRLVVTEPRIRRVLEVCDLDRVFRIATSVASAVDDPAPPGSR